MMPSVLDEVAASTPGPQVGAFFDFDGTLIAGYSAAVMAEDRLRRGEVSLADVGRSLGAGLQVVRGQADMGDFMKLTARGWQGRTHEDLEELGERLFVQKIVDWVYPEARELVAAHQRRGHTVALTSSATRYQVGAIARELGIGHVLCTELELVDGVLTGLVAAPALWGRGKADAVQKFAVQQGVDLAQSWFYADGDEDLGLMHLVGHPRPTNPRPRLEQVARRRGWPVQRFSSRGRASAVTRLRSAAGWLSAGPVAAVAVGVGVVRRDRAAAVEVARSCWLDALFTATGVSVQVTGQEHLEADRPAVFVFNHRTEFDALIAARVVGADVVGLATAGTTRSVVGSALARLGQLVVLAADDPEDAALLAARQVIVTSGRSVLAAPERVRAPGERVASFAPEAFRLAMAASVPVIPVVIRNAESLGPRRAKVVRSGAIDVAVLPAIPTADWTQADLEQRVEDVRQRFVTVLADWPS